MATRLPRICEDTAMMLVPITHRGDNVTRSMPTATRSNTIKAAPFGTTDRNAVTGVGDP